MLSANISLSQTPTLCKNRTLHFMRNLRYPNSVVQNFNRNEICIKLQRQWCKICVRSVPESGLKFVRKLAFFMFLGWILGADFFSFDNCFTLQCFFQPTSSVLMEHWIPFICCKENYFVFADLWRKCFLRISLPPKSAAGKSAASFTRVAKLAPAFGAKFQKFRPK